MTSSGSHLGTRGTWLRKQARCVLEQPHRVRCPINCSENGRGQSEPDNVDIFPPVRPQKCLPTKKQTNKKKPRLSGLGNVRQIAALSDKTGRV